MTVFSCHLHEFEPVIWCGNMRVSPGVAPSRSCLFWFSQPWIFPLQQPPIFFLACIFSTSANYFVQARFAFRISDLLASEFLHCTRHGQEQAIKPAQASDYCSEEGNSAVVGTEGIQNLPCFDSGCLLRSILGVANNSCEETWLQPGFL